MKAHILNLKTIEDEGHQRKLTIYGGLHYIKGNSSPYFSLTYWCGGPNTGHGGAGHDFILEHFPQYADLAALHLSDMDGSPMHPIENGFYHLGGTEWQPANFKHAASHFHITEDEARGLAEDIFGYHYSATVGHVGNTTEAKKCLAAWVETQKPRWAKEATDCIAKHGLVVYGDFYEAT